MLALPLSRPAERAIKALPHRRSRAGAPSLPPTGASSAASASPCRSHTSHASHSTTTSLDLSYLTHDTTLPDNDPELPPPAPVRAAAGPPPVPLPALLHDLHTSSAALLEASQRAVDVFSAYASASSAAAPDGAPASAVSEAHLAAMLRLRSAVDIIRQHSEAFLAGSSCTVDARTPTQPSSRPPPPPAAATSWDAYALGLWGCPPYSTRQGPGRDGLTSDSGGSWHLASAAPAAPASTWSPGVSATQEPGGEEETYDDEYACEPAPWSRGPGNNKKRKSIRAKSDASADIASDDASHTASPTLASNPLGADQPSPAGAGKGKHTLPATADRLPHSLPNERQSSRRPDTARQRARNTIGPSSPDVCLPGISVSSSRPLQVRLNPPTQADGTPWPDPQRIQLPGLATRVPVPLPGKKKKLSKAEKKAKVHTRSRGRRPTLAELRARVQGAKADDQSLGGSPLESDTAERFAWAPPTVMWPDAPPGSASPPLRSLDWLSCRSPRAKTREPFTFLVSGKLSFPTQVPQLARFAPALAPPRPVGEHEYLMLFHQQLAAALAPVTEAERHLVQARKTSRALPCKPDGPESEPAKLIQAALEAIASAQLAIPPALLTGLGALEKARSRTETQETKPSGSPLFASPRPAEPARSPVVEPPSEPQDQDLAPSTCPEPTGSQSGTQGEEPDSVEEPVATTATLPSTEQEAPDDTSSERSGRKTKPKKLSRRQKAAMNNVHHRCNWTQRGGARNGEAKQKSSRSPQQAGTNIPAGCLDHPTTSNALFPDEYVCLLCDYELLYGEEPRMLASIRRRVRVEESRSWARARAHRLAKGQCPHDTGCGCADSPYPD